MFTKGEWKADIRVGCVAVYADNETTRSYLPCIPNPDVCVYYKLGKRGKDGWELNEELIANANLIAAAPKQHELLKLAVAELKITIEDIGGCDHTVGICCCSLANLIDDIDKVIAKAEGSNLFNY